MDIAEYNRRAWDGQVDKNNQWTVPVSPDVIAAARNGLWQIVLTPTKAVPADWFPPLQNTRILCLAGSGGQQAPILAAAGATVTVLDNSPKQLGQDRLVAERENLSIETVLGDMRDLSMFANNSFDLVVHPCSNTFIPNVLPVWQEVARVLRPGGQLLAGFINPLFFLFDEAAMNRGELVVRFRLPYTDETSLTKEELEQLKRDGEPLVFSHSLEDLLGGQAQAGLHITGLFEDTWPNRMISEYIPTFIATRSRKV